MIQTLGRMALLVFFLLLSGTLFCQQDKEILITVPPSGATEYQPEKKIVSTSLAPAAIGPYSQAVIAGGLIFVSGQLGLDPQTKDFVKGGIKEQTEQVIKNISAILKTAECSLDAVVSCTVYMKDLKDFEAMNFVYGSYFSRKPPSRATVQVDRLPKDGLVEISCIAIRPVGVQLLK
jgi:2-iminobutanoate/2-iminopropanoate deaminase